MIYHDPGNLRSYRLFEEISDLLKKLISANIMSVPLSSIKKASLCNGLVVALLPHRGGHFATISSLYGNRVCGPIPAPIVALHIHRSISSKEVNEIILAYYGTKRYKEEQQRDILRIMSITEHLTGKKLIPVAYPDIASCNKDQLVVPLSMGPGLLTKKYTEAGCQVAPTLMESSMDLIISWIIGCVNSVY